MLANRALSAEGCSTLLQVGALSHLLGHCNDLEINVSIAAVGAVRSAFLFPSFSFSQVLLMVFLLNGQEYGCGWRFCMQFSDYPSQCSFSSLSDHADGMN